jgi:hypothetical protein
MKCDGVVEEIPMVIVSSGGERIFSVLRNGDFVLRGKVVANDAEVADILSGAAARCRRGAGGAKVTLA